MLIKTNAVSPVKSQQKWNNDLCTEEKVAEINWKSAHTISYNCTKSTKLRCFHFKLLKRRIATNVFLCKAGIYPTDHCTFCKQEPDTLLHLYLNCSVTCEFWEDIKTWVKRKYYPKSIQISDFVLLGLEKSLLGEVIDPVLLVGRYYLYCGKYDMTCPTFASYKAKLESYCQIEREIAVQSNNIEAFITRWDPFLE